MFDKVECVGVFPTPTGLQKPSFFSSSQARKVFSTRKVDSKSDDAGTAD